MTDNHQADKIFLLKTKNGPTDIRVGDIWSYGAFEVALVLREGKREVRYDHSDSNITEFYTCQVYRFRENDVSPWCFSNFKGSDEVWRLLARVEEE